MNLLQSTVHLMQCTGLNTFSTFRSSPETLAKWCLLMPPSFLSSPLPCLQNVFLWGLFSFGGIKRSRTERDQVNKLGHAVFGKKLFHTQGFVRWRVVVVKPPLPTLPQLGVFSSHHVMQTFQNFQVKRLVNSLTVRNKFWVDNAICIKKKKSASSWLWTSLAVLFLGRGEVELNHWLDCYFISKLQA